MDFIQAARLKHFILKNFSVVLHIHDTCGGMYLSIDEPNEMVKEFILAFCRELSIPVTVSSDGRSFYPGKEKIQMKEKEEITIHFQAPDNNQGCRDNPEARNIQGSQDSPDNNNQGRVVVYYEGSLIGECTFTETKEQWIVDHSWVDSAYRSRGIAGRMMEMVFEEAKKRAKKLVPVCSYADRWLKEH